MSVRVRQIARCSLLISFCRSLFDASAAPLKEITEHRSGLLSLTRKNSSQRRKTEQSSIYRCLLTSFRRIQTTSRNSIRYLLLLQTRQLATKTNMFRCIYQLRDFIITSAQQSKTNFQHVEVLYWITSALVFGSVKRQISKYFLEQITRNWINAGCESG